MNLIVPRFVRRAIATAALVGFASVSTGCASPQHAVKGLFDTGFDVARHVVVGGADLGMKATELTFSAAESAGKGTLNALVK